MTERCSWCGKDDLYCKYHDEEWGVPVHDEKKHFEFLVLESAQAGLSWITILRKRENYRLAYDDFDFEKVSKYDEIKVQELMNNKGIVRNKLKIEASINNAKCFLKIQDEFGSFDKYIWAFVNNKPIQNKFETIEELPAITELSKEISKSLKKRGFKFLGPTTIYAHMQAIGMVNDHLTTCYRYNELNL